MREKSELSITETEERITIQKIKELLIEVIRTKDTEILSSNDLLSLVGNVELLFRISETQVRDLSTVEMDRSLPSLIRALETARILNKEYCRMD